MRSAARRRAKFSSARAGGRGRAPAGEGAKAHDLQPGVVALCSSVRVGVGESLVSCSSINFGRPGALLGSSVAFGSGCGQALPGVPRKAPLYSYH